MSWNYRVQKIKTVPHSFEEEEEFTYEVVEAYYDKEYPDKVSSWTNSRGLIGDTYEELQESYKLVASAFEKPIIDQYGGEI